MSRLYLVTLLALNLSLVQLYQSFGYCSREVSFAIVLYLAFSYPYGFSVSLQNSLECVSWMYFYPV